MYVSTSEFRANIGKYLDLASQEKIYIMRHGKLVATLLGNDDSKEELMNSILGACSYEGDVDRLLEKRLDAI
jgi:predicted hydrolase (HD superfamily)